MLKLIFSIFLAPLLLGFSTNELYTSTVNATYNANSRIVALELEVGTNNLNELLNSISGGEFDVLLAKDERAALDILDDYLQQNFLMIQNGKVLPLSVLEIKPDARETIIVFEIEVIETEQIQLKNTLFFEIYPTQINIVKIKGETQYNEYYFDAQNPDQEIVL